jgi:hypothetical protein
VNLVKSLGEFVAQRLYAGKRGMDANEIDSEENAAFRVGLA